MDGAGTDFNSIADMEDWLNTRLAVLRKSIDLSSYPLVLCHMNICRRNMILEEHNTIYLLDRGSTWLYPRIFDIASLSFMNPYNEPHEKPLRGAVTTLLGLMEEENISEALTSGSCCGLEMDIVS